MCEEKLVMSWWIVEVKLRISKVSISTVLSYSTRLDFLFFSIASMNLFSLEAYHIFKENDADFE